MNKDEIIKKAEENIAYLQKTIPPDDIYIFTEQTFMAAMYFLWKWSKKEDLVEEMKNDPISKKWISNIIQFHHAKNEKIDMIVDLNFGDEE